MESKLLKQEPVEYKGSQYYVYLTRYIDGKPAIFLNKKKDINCDSDCIVLTVNLEDLQMDEVAVIDPQDNGYEFQLLETLGIVEYCGIFPSGWNVYLGGRLVYDKHNHSEVEDTWDELGQMKMRSLIEW